MTAAGQLSFTFDAVPADDDNTTPAINTTTRRVLLGLWELTARTTAGQWYEGTATAGELLDTLGIYSPGGWDYDNLRRVFKTLQRMRVEFDNRRRGAERVEWEFSGPIVWRAVLGDGKDARYFWALNPETVSPVTTRWLLGEFDLDTATRKEFASEAKKAAGGIIKFPTRYTRERLPAHVDNARLALLSHNWQNTPTAYKLLTGWLCVRPSQLEKPTEAISLVFDTLDDLRRLGLIGDYKPTRPADPTKYTKRDLRRLKFKLTPPPTAALGLTSEQHDQYIDVLTWLADPQHGTKTTEPKRRAQLDRAYKAYTADHVHRVYLEHKRAEDVAGFWEALFPKSRRRKRSKPSAADADTESAIPRKARSSKKTPTAAEVVRQYAEDHQLADPLDDWPVEHQAGVADQLKETVAEYRNLPIGAAWKRVLAGVVKLSESAPDGKTP
jgi:hypothetical protein